MHDNYCTNNEKTKGRLLYCLNGRIMKNILVQFYLLAHIFCPHVFVVTNSYCRFFQKKDKKTKINFFLHKRI